MSTDPITDGDEAPTEGYRHSPASRPRWLLAVTAVVIAVSCLAALVGCEHGPAPESGVRTATTSPNTPATPSSLPGASATTSPATPPASSSPAMPSASSSPASSSAVRAAGKGAAAAVPVTREAPRAEIPWAQVGGGWTAAVWAATVSPGPGTLYLLSPAGTRYAVGAVPANTYVADVSPDGRRVLTVEGNPAGLVEWDVAAGAPRTINVPPPIGGSREVRYSKPSARAVLVLNVTRQPAVLERRGLDGSLESSYPDTSSYLAAPDGKDLVAARQDGLAVVSNPGSVIRSLPAPGGYESCTPLSWWSAGAVLVQCSAKSSQATPNLWVYPVSGAPATQLTKATVASGAEQFGYLMAWRYSGGTLIEAGAGCGHGGLGILNASGKGDSRRLNIPAEPGSDTAPDVQAVVGDNAYLTVEESCGAVGARSLVRYDLGKDAPTYFLGTKANGGTVVSSVVIDPSR